MNEQLGPFRGKIVDPRQKQFDDFLKQETFFCSIGGNDAREGQIAYTVLQPGDNDDLVYAKIEAGAQVFIDNGTGAWVIILPEDPEGYDAVKDATTKIRGDVLAAVSELQITGNLEALRSAHPELAKVRGVVHQLRAREPDRHFTMYPWMFLSPLAGDEEVSALQPSEINGNIARFRSTARELVQQFPNVAPATGDRDFQMLMMSPVFQNGLEERRREVYEKLGRGHWRHPRYAPVNGLVATYKDEVAAAMKRGKPGPAIRQSRIDSPFRHNPNHILAERYDDDRGQMQRELAFLQSMELAAGVIENRDQLPAVLAALRLQAQQEPALRRVIQMIEGHMAKGNGGTVINVDTGSGTPNTPPAQKRPQSTGLSSEEKKRHRKKRRQKKNERKKQRRRKKKDK